VDDLLWFYDPLQEEEMDRDGLWDCKTLLWALFSLDEAMGLPECKDQIWRAIEEGSFWTGERCSRDLAKMWSMGSWLKPRGMRVMQFGCLKCGCRTPQLKPWLKCKMQMYGARTGKEATMAVLEGLFASY
jgi:hypothetical protein